MRLPEACRGPVEQPTCRRKTKQTEHEAAKETTTGIKYILLKNVVPFNFELQIKADKNATPNNNGVTVTVLDSPDSSPSEYIAVNTYS